MPHKSIIPSSREESNSKAARARRLLTRGPLPREDSDDELGQEDLPWQWVYSAEESSTTDTNNGRRDIGDREEDDAPVPTTRRKSKSHRSASQSYDQKITGARMGSFECKIGDCVLLKAEGEGNKAWVGIICEFADDENDDMSVNIMCKCSS